MGKFLIFVDCRSSPPAGVAAMTGTSAHRAVSRTRLSACSAGARLLWAACVLALAACSPALNWRSVPLGETSVTLPCKPDRGQRPVQLGEYALNMEMVGCEADGALFAVSRVRVPDGVAPGVLQAQWQSASLQQMRAQAPPEWEAHVAGSKSLPVRVWQAQGRQADGQAVQAKLAWVGIGGDLVHLAVYAPRLTPELTEAFFDGIRAP